MKKLFLIFLLCCLGTQLSHSQKTSLRFEGTFDIVTGESSDYNSFALTGSLSYHFRLFKGMSVGPLAGYRHSFGPSEDEYEGVDPSFVPLAVSADIRPFSSAQWISLGGDVGQALSLDDSFEGGLFYRPRLGLEFLGGAQFVITNTVIETNEEVSFTSWNFGWVFYL